MLLIWNKPFFLAPIPHPPGTFLYKAGFSDCQQQKLTLERPYWNNMGKLRECIESAMISPRRNQDPWEIWVAGVNERFLQGTSIGIDFPPLCSCVQGPVSWKKEWEWPALGNLTTHIPWPWHFDICSKILCHGLGQFPKDNQGAPSRRGRKGCWADEILDHSLPSLLS